MIIPRLIASRFLLTFSRFLPILWTAYWLEKSKGIIVQMKRIRYFDLLRCVSFCFIIFYHMVIQLHLSEICSLESITSLFSNSNMHIATLGVAVFFMLSGASLVYTTKNDFDLKKYYKKRCLRILIPFYLTYFVYLLAKIVVHHSLQGIFPEKIPTWRAFFTILGMDGWVSMHGIATFSLGIGEWFLGCLIVLYLVFPLLRSLMEKNAKLFFVCATCIYVLTAFFYQEPQISKDFWGFFRFHANCFLSRW